MKIKNLLIILLSLNGFIISSKCHSQAFTITKPKINITAESYGLGIDNFGIIDTNGKEILDIKNIKYGDRVNMAFYNINGFNVDYGYTHLRMTMSVINLTDNTIVLPSETLLDEKIAPEKLKDEYLYGYLTISKDFEKGKTYLLRLHLWDVLSGYYADLIWKFKANFK